jgi:hypothetical protein
MTITNTPSTINNYGTSQNPFSDFNTSEYGELTNFSSPLALKQEREKLTNDKNILSGIATPFATPNPFVPTETHHTNAWEKLAGATEGNHIDLQKIGANAVTGLQHFNTTALAVGNIATLAGNFSPILKGATAAEELVSLGKQAIKHIPA